MATNFRTYKTGGLTWRLAVDSQNEKLRILADPDRWLRDPAFVIKRSSAAIVARIPYQAGAGWILKRFQPRNGSATLKNVFRASRALKEMEMAELLERAGVPVGRIVAAAEKRKARVLESSYLVSEEIPDATTLQEFLRHHKNGPARRRVLEMLAGILARLHNAGFSHSDLNPANFLVRASGGKVRLWLIDLEGITHSPARIAQELRRLNRRLQVPTFTRLRFLKIYCGLLKPPLPTRDLMNKILAGEREWEIRRIGNRRWKVRLHLVNEQARAIMADPLAAFRESAVASRAVQIRPTDPSHPGFSLLRTSGETDRPPDAKTIAFTDSLLGRERVGFVLKLR